MTAFLDSVEQYFGSRDLYEALRVEKTAKDSELKRAYHRLSLLVHPDRVPPEEVEEATKKFQVLGKVYAVLSDTDKRALYDEDGTVDEEDSSIFNQDRDWTQYWRLLFKKVTVEDIKSFERSYKGSEEERETVRSAYLSHQGDMEKIIEEVLCATVDDEPRLRELISQWIAEGEVPDFPAFSGETEQKRTGRKRKHEEEAREAEQVMREMGMDPDGGGDDSLKALIQARQQSREAQVDGFFNSLEEKYAKKPKGQKGQSKLKASSSKVTKAPGTKKGKKK